MAQYTPPNNLSAERSILGAALLDRDALADAAGALRPDDFYDPRHEELFAIMQEMAEQNRPVDILTVSDELSKRKKLEKAGGRSYIAELSTDVPAIGNVQAYIEIVQSSSQLRRLISVCGKIQQKCFENSETTSEIMDFAEKSVFTIAQSRQTRDFTPLEKIVDRDVEIISETSQNGGRIPGLPTGFRQLDYLTAGLQRSDLIILAARPAMGKTAFALNVALNAAKNGGTVLIFSLEMSKEQLGQRMLSMQSSIEMERLQKGQIASQSEWEELYAAHDQLARLKIFIDDSPGATVFEMRNKCRRLKAKEGLDLVVVDYLQLMQSPVRADSRQQEISALSRNMKLLAREMDCPVIVLSQLSRAPEQRPNHRPILSDLRESGSIEQDADIVMFLYRDDYYNEDSDKPGICEVNLAKHRNGPTGTLELTWVSRYTKFSDKAGPSDEAYEPV